MAGYILSQSAKQQLCPPQDNGLWKISLMLLRSSKNLRIELLYKDDKLLSLFI